MNRVGYNKFIILSLLILILLSSVISAAQRETDVVSISDKSQQSLATAGSTTPPVFYDTFYVCPGGSIFDTLGFLANNVADTSVKMEIVEGPGNLVVERFPLVDSIYGYFSYIPEVEGTVTTTIRVINRFSDSLYFIHNYATFFIADSVVLENQNFSSVACDLKTTRELHLSSIGGGITFNLLSGSGSIDPVTGVISYQPDTSGFFQFEVEAVSACGADTAIITDSVHLNTPPQVFCYDSLVQICSPEEICFDIFGVDPDSDPVELFMLEGIGEFTMTSDSTGRACFMPADLDSAVYRFIFRGADSCTITADKDPMGDCCRDTSLITVVINRPPELTCPDTQYFFGCEPSEFCFDISAFDYENGLLTYNILSGNATINNNTVCVTGDTESQFDVVIEVVDDCGFADTCTVPVNININDAPIVNSADDFSMNLCNPETICFSATIDDANLNIYSINVNFGTYNDETQLVCFTPDTSGTYSIVITATDSCGMVDSSVTNVSVHINEEPVISLGEDYSLDICAEQEICIEPFVADDGIYSIYTNFSFLQWRDRSNMFSYLIPRAFIL